METLIPKIVNCYLRPNAAQQIWEAAFKLNKSERVLPPFFVINERWAMFNNTSSVSNRLVCWDYTEITEIYETIHYKTNLLCLANGQVFTNQFITFITFGPNKAQFCLMDERTKKTLLNNWI